MNVDLFVPLVILLPLLGAVLLHFVGRRIGEPMAGWIATAAIGTSFVLGAASSIDFIRGTGTESGSCCGSGCRPSGRRSNCSGTRCRPS
jgi:hypothetical protein